MYSRFTPTCFSKSSGGCRYLRRYSSDIHIVGVYGLRSVQCVQLLWDVTKGTIHSWLHLTTDHTGRIIVHIHPQYRYCLSSFCSNYNPLMLAITCWNKVKERPTKRIFKVNHKFRISILLLHVLALQEHHLQGAQNILIKLCGCYVISAE
jgi:hypothetical protein